MDIFILFYLLIHFQINNILITSQPLIQDQGIHKQMQYFNYTDFKSEIHRQKMNRFQNGLFVDNTPLKKRYFGKVPINSKFPAQYAKQIFNEQQAARLQLQITIATVNQKQIIVQKKKSNIFSVIQNLQQLQKKLTNLNQIYEESNKKYIKQLFLFRQKEKQFQVSQLIFYNIKQEYQQNINNHKILKQLKANENQKKVNQSHLLFLYSIQKIEEAKLKMDKYEQLLKQQIIKKVKIQTQYHQSLQDVTQKNKAFYKAIQYNKSCQQTVNQAYRRQKQANRIRSTVLSQFLQADKEQASYNLLKKQNLNKILPSRINFQKVKQQVKKLQWEYELLLNKLYVAQARKYTADRLAEVAQSQKFSEKDQSQQIAEIKLIQIQVNCHAYNYPVIQGVATLISKHKYLYEVSSGHRILVGPCTVNSQVFINQLIYFTGFIVQGYVHATQIKKHS